MGHFVLSSDCRLGRNKMTGIVQGLMVTFSLIVCHSRRAVFEKMRKLFLRVIVILSLGRLNNIGTAS